jgi:hypothetical protein
MPEFPELKDIVVRPEPVNYLPWIFLGVVLLLCVLGFGYWLWRILTRNDKTVTAPTLIEARNAALDNLDQIRVKVPELTSEETVVDVQTVLRRFLHRHHGALGLYRTADELIGRTGRGKHASPPPNPTLAHIEDILRRCEALRYNQEELPDEPSRLDLVDQAMASLKEN